MAPHPARFSRRHWLAGCGSAALSIGIRVRAAQAEELPIHGDPAPGGEGIDQGIIDFLQETGVPGVSVAISKHGRSVYERSFGFVERGQSDPVEPHSLFRIASLSKPLTGAAMAILMERDHVRPSDRVHEILELRAPRDDRWKRVTVEQLLWHVGGWDRSKSFDPMFHSREIVAARQLRFPISQWDIIDFMLDQPLDHDPGAMYAYSNFGYCLLGRIIEKRTRMSYESFVRQVVLDPLGMKHERIGGTLRSERLESEVVYHDESDRTDTSVVTNDGERFPYPYGVWDLRVMDSHGGWLATASDLIRFACDFDDPRASKILSADSIKRIFSPPDPLPNEMVAPVTYGYGWQIRDLSNGRKNTWHTGRLSGTATLLVRRHDGWNWAVLLNAHADKEGQAIGGKVDRLMHRLVDASSLT